MLVLMLVIVLVLVLMLVIVTGLDCGVRMESPAAPSPAFDVQRLQLLRRRVQRLLPLSFCHRFNIVTLLTM
jgi:hypothetical protein